MIELKRRSDSEYYISYSGDSLQDYLEYTSFLSSVKNRNFDEKIKQWYCDRIESQKIQDCLNNKNIGQQLKLKPYDYQRQGIAFCKKHKFGVIVVPCGAGKTPMGLGAFLELRKDDPEISGVFVVKASLKNQWLDEVKKFTDLKASALYTYKYATRNFCARIRQREAKLKKLAKDAVKNVKEINALEKEINSLKEERDDFFAAMFDAKKYDIFVVNYETIVDESVRNMLHKVNPQFWYVDEVDCIKSNTTQRSKALYEFNDAKYRFGATATPIRKNPKDLFGIFSFIYPALFPNEREFDRTYLRFWYGRVSGSQNEEQLSEKVEPHIFRRDFDQIADQLPKQIVRQIYCNFTPKQREVFEELSREIDDLNDKKKAMYNRFTPQQLANNAEYRKIEDGIAARQTFAQMQADSEELLVTSESNMAHKYITGDRSAKIEICVALVEKIIASGQKVCIFSRYLGIQDILKREFGRSKEIKDQKVDSITGSTAADERSRVLKDVNEKDDHNILLLSDSGEAGLNLSKVRYMIEMELADSAAKQTQRHGRIQRADSIHKNVFVFQLITKNSWDEIQEKIVNKKQEYADRILS